MHRTALADEPRPEIFENPIGIHQDAPKAFHVLRIVGGVAPILIERSGVVELLRGGTNADLDSERVQAGHVLTVEIRDRAREQWNPVLALAGSNRQIMRNQIELHLESPLPKWNGWGDQAARRD